MNRRCRRHLALRARRRPIDPLWLQSWFLRHPPRYENAPYSYEEP